MRGDHIFKRMHTKPLSDLKWAYQLHYYLCFQTHRSQNIISNPDREAALSAAFAEICQRHELHLVRLKINENHVRLLLSLRPSETISKVVQTVKTNSARAFSSACDLNAPIWGRGYLAKSVGRVRTGEVKRYIEGQSEHHGYAKRVLPPVYRFRSDCPKALVAEHSVFELNHHLVFATKHRAGIFGASVGHELCAYWIRVAQKHGFAIDRCTFVPDHVHLLIRTMPNMSVEKCAFSLLNNGQYFMVKHAPKLLVEAGIDQLWQDSAYVGTTGEFTTALMKSFLKE
jgi:putative transposase